MRQGRSEGEREGRKRAKERGSEEEMELRSEGDEQRREQGRAGNVKGCALRRTLSIQYTANRTTHNAALALETLVLKIVNGYNYKLRIVMRRNVLCDRWMT